MLTPFRALLALPLLTTALVAAASAGGCSGSSDQPSAGSTGGASSGTGSGTGGQGGGLVIDVDGSTGEECSANNKLVYVLVSATPPVLFRFDPASLAFTKVGEIVCDFKTPSPPIAQSMSVDRHGTAWVTFTNGLLAQVSTTNAACMPTAFNADAQGVTYLSGMAFVSPAGQTSEQLHVMPSGPWRDDGSGLKLGTLDTSALTVALGPLVEPSVIVNGDLSGTGDGRLFAILPELNGTTYISLLDTATGKQAVRKLVPSFGTKKGIAFAQWGGDLWLFTAAPDGKARVAQFLWESGTLAKTADSDLGVTGFIVGAGVSTCAPFVPPA